MPDNEKRYTINVDGKQRTVKADVFHNNIDQFVNDMPDATVQMVAPDKSVKAVKISDLSSAYDNGYDYATTDKPIYSNTKAPETHKEQAPATPPASQEAAKIQNAGLLQSMFSPTKASKQEFAPPAIEKPINVPFKADDNIQPKPVTTEPSAEQTAQQKGSWRDDPITIGYLSKGQHDSTYGQVSDELQQQYADYYNKLSSLYDKGQSKDKPSASSFILQKAIDLGVKEAGDDTNIAQVGTNSKGQKAMAGSAGDMNNTYSLAMTVGQQFLNQQAAAAAQDIVSKLPNQLSQDPIDDIRNAYYDEKLQKNLYKIAALTGVDYEDLVNDKIKPALQDAIKQKYNGLDISVNGLFSNLKNVGHEVEQKNADSIISANVQQPIQAAIDKFDEMAKQATEGALSTMGTDVAGMPAGMRLGTLNEANREGNVVKDPQKILSYLSGQVKSIVQNPQFVQSISKEAKKAGCSTADYFKTYVQPRIGSILKQELNKGEIARVIPKGSFEYIMKSGLGNSIVGQINRKLSQTDYQNWLEDMANSDYANNKAGFWDKIASGGVTFAADMWSYLLPGGVGGKVTQSMAKSATSKLARDLAVKGMEKSAAERAAAVIVRKNLGQRITQGVASGAITFGGQSVVSTPANEIYKNNQPDFDSSDGKYHTNVGKILAKTVENVGKGAVMGALMQGNTVASALTEGKGLVANIAGGLAGTAADATVMGTQGILEHMSQDPNFKPTGKDAAESFAESFASLKMLGLPHTISKYMNFRDQKEFNHIYNFNDEDLKTLQDNGYSDLYDAFLKLGTAHSRGEQPQQDSVEVMKQLTPQYMTFLNDKTIPETTKAKVMGVIEGTRPNKFSPVTDTELDGNVLTLHSADGGVIDKKRYDSDKAAEEAAKKLDFAKSLNTTSAFEGMYQNLAFKDELKNSYEDVKQKYMNGEPLDDKEKQSVYLFQNMNKISNVLEKKQAGTELNAEEQQLFDAYQSIYADRMRRSNVLDQFADNFEKSNGLAKGYLQEALLGHSKDEANKLADADNDETVQLGDHYRTGAEQKAIDAYQDQLRRDIDSMSSRQDEADNSTKIENGEQPAEQQPTEKPGLPVPEQQVQTEQPTATQTEQAATEPQQPVNVQQPAQTNNPREAAYERGTNIINDESQLANIQYDVDLADASMSNAFPATDSRLNKIRTDIVDAIENRDDATVDAILQKHSNTLTDSQLDAVEKYRNASETQRGIEDSITQQSSEFAEQRKNEIANITRNDGTVTPLLLDDGTTVYHLSGDLNNKYGGVVVATEDGQTRQIPTSEIAQVGQQQDAKDIVDADVNNFANEMQQNYKDIANGTSLVEGQQVDLSVAGNNFHVTVQGEDPNGNYVFQGDDGSQFALSPQETSNAIASSNQLKINTQLEQDRQSANQKAAQDRLNKGIVGITEGKPDYSNRKSDPKVSADYLKKMSDGNTVDTLKNIQAEKEALANRMRTAEADLKRQNGWMEANGDLYSDEEKAMKKKVISDRQNEVNDIINRQHQWGEIRNNLMTPEEHTKFANDRIDKVIKAKESVQSNIDKVETTPDKDLDKETLLSNYKTEADAHKYLIDKREAIMKDYRTGAGEELSKIRRSLDSYQNGYEEMNDSEIAASAKRLSELEQEEASTIDRINNIKATDSNLGRYYKERNDEELHKLSPREQREIELNKATSYEYLVKKAKEVYGKTDYGDSIADLEPRTLEEFVASRVPVHGINWEGRQVGGAFQNGLQQEAGLNRGIGNDKDTSAINYFLAPKGEGKSLANVVHDIWSERGDGQFKDATTEDVRNILIDLLTSARKPTDITRLILRNRINDAEMMLHYTENAEKDYLEKEAAERQAKENEYLDYLDAMSEEVPSAEVVNYIDGIIADEITDREQELAEVDNKTKQIIEKNETKQINEDENEQREEPAVTGSRAMDKEPERATARTGSDKGKEVVSGKESVKQEIGNENPQQQESKPAETTVRTGNSDVDGSIPVQQENKPANLKAENNKINTDRNGNFIGDGSIHNDYSISDFSKYPQITHSVSKSNTTESVYVTYKNTENRKFVTLRFSGHNNNAVKFGDELNGDTTSDNEILYRLGLKQRKFVPIKHKIIPTQQVSKKKIEDGSYQEADVTMQQLYDLPAGSDISEYKGKIAKDSNYLITGDKVQEYTETDKNAFGDVTKVGDYEYYDISKHDDANARLEDAKQDVDTNPTEGQKKAGNYKMGHLKFAGFDYTIENPKGSTRSGKDPGGKAWSIKMNNTYGYIRGKVGVDGDQIDMFINDDVDLDKWHGTVFVVDQVNPDGTFDEHKIMYGFADLNAAKEAYFANYAKGWKGLGNITGVSYADFKKWIDSSNRKTKPFAEYKLVQDSQSKDANDDMSIVANAKGKKFINKKGETLFIKDYVYGDSNVSTVLAGNPTNINVKDLAGMIKSDKWIGDSKLTENNPYTLSDAIDAMNEVMDSPGLYFNVENNRDDALKGLNKLLDAKSNLLKALNGKQIKGAESNFFDKLDENISFARAVVDSFDVKQETKEDPHGLEYFKKKYPYSSVKEHNGNIVKYDNNGQTTLLELNNPNDEDLLYGFYTDPFHLIKNKPTGNPGLGSYIYEPIGEVEDKHNDTVDAILDEVDSRKTKTEEPVTAEEKERFEAPVDTSILSNIRTRTIKSGETRYTVKPIERVDHETYEKYNDWAKQCGGFYARKFKCYLFKTEDDAKKFKGIGSKPAEPTTEEDIIEKAPKEEVDNTNKEVKEQEEKDENDEAKPSFTKGEKIFYKGRLATVESSDGNNVEILDDGSTNMLNMPTHVVTTIFDKNIQKITAINNPSQGRHGFQVGDKVLYRGKNATIFDFDEVGLPILDTGYAPVMYETAQKFSDIKKINDNGNISKEATDEQTATTTEAIASTGSLVEEQTQLDKDDTLEDLRQKVDDVDASVADINDQLALLGYYDTTGAQPENENESTGYMRVAEKKFKNDLEKLSKVIAKAYGLTPEQRKKKDVWANTNLAPIGGEGTIKLCLPDGRKLAIYVSVDRVDVPGKSTAGIDNLKVVNAVMRIEDNRDGGTKYGIDELETGKLSFDTIEKDLNNILGQKPSIHLVEAVKSISTNKKSKKVSTKSNNGKKKTVSSQTEPQQLDLFGDYEIPKKQDNGSNNETTSRETGDDGRGRRQVGTVLAPTDDVSKPNIPVPNAGTGDKKGNNTAAEEPNGNRNSTVQAGPSVGSGDGDNPKRSDGGKQDNGDLSRGGRTERLGDTKDKRSDNGRTSKESEGNDKSEGTRGSGRHVLDESPVEIENGGDKDIAGNPKTEREKSAPKNTRNFLLPDDIKDGTSYSQKQMGADNIRALEIIRDLIREKREATEDERKELGRFHGWGNLDIALKYSANYVDYNLRDQYNQLHQVISEIDPTGNLHLLDSIRNAALTAFYTPPSLGRVIGQIMKMAGVKNGRFLDPSFGNGLFESTMPKDMQQSMQIHGIELDWLTGMISKHLFPDANIDIKGFQDVPLADNSFMAVASNIPFGNISILDKDWKANKTDPVHKSAMNMIHNYFAVNMMDKTAPGGLCVIMSSNSIMDTPSNGIIRRYLRQKGKLLMAVRLPDNMFKSTGTRVVTDVMFFRKYKEGESPLKDEDWTEIGEKELPSKIRYSEIKVSYNTYYQKHPELMFGEPKAGGQYSADTFGLSSDMSTEEISAKVLAAAKKYISPNIVDVKRQEHVINTEIKTAYKGNGKYERNGNLVMQDGVIGVLEGSLNPKTGQTDVKFNSISKYNSKTMKPKVIAYGNIRQAMKEIIYNEINKEDNDKLASERVNLKKLYNAFVSKYGKLCDKSNDFILDDIDGYSVRGLEKWESSKFIGLADIFDKNTIKPINNITTADNPGEALKITLSEYGSINSKKMQELIGDDWVKQCGDMIFQNPSTGDYETRDEYLSGNVKAKLSDAERAAKNDNKYDVNVKALKDVVPIDIPADLISIRMGARWIPLEIYKQFALDKVGIGLDIEYLQGEDNFKIDIYSGQYGSLADKYQTKEKSIKDIFDAAINDKQLVVYNKIDDKVTVDVDKTKDANDKVSDLRRDFTDWSIVDPKRADLIQRTYNDTFNCVVLRKYDGSHLQTPGLSGKTLRPHQKDAVWMILQNRGGIIDHIVGAGKTLVMQAAIMEMRRMGIAKKPVILAIKSTVPQISKEFHEAYPSANILVPKESEFGNPDKRKKFLSNVAVNDYDCVILSHDQYNQLDHSPEIIHSVYNEQLDQLDATLQYLYNTDDKSNLTKKQIKGLLKRREKLENKIKELMDKRTDSEFTFESMGIDYMFIDESHDYKNLQYVTSYGRVAGLGSPAGNLKTEALLFGIRYLQQMHQGDKGVTFLSGTTITNSLSELYNLFNYLRPNEMKRLGLNSFDSWASVFVERSNEPEFDIINKIKPKVRFRDYLNVPELSRMYAEITDVRNDNNLKLPKPEENRHLVVVEPDEAQNEIQNDVQNMLKTHDGTAFGRVTTDPKKEPWSLLATTISSKAAIDARLVRPDSPDNPNSKLSKCAANVAELYKKFDKQKGVQLIFSDLGVPNKNKFNVYDELVRKLHEDFGIPLNEIAKIHDYDTDKKRKELFEKAKSGEIRVIIGNTSKLGTGVNIQERLIAEHHIDVPWTPANLNQRVGRLIRQGNNIALNFNNNKGEVFYYVTKNSLDAYRYQLLSTKQNFIDQVKNGTVTEREISDDDSDEESGFSYATVVSVLSGNPAIMERAKLGKQVDDLRRRKRNHEADLARRMANYKDAKMHYDAITMRIEGNDRDRALLVRNGFIPDKDGKYPWNFLIVADDNRFDNFKTVKEAGEKLLSLIGNAKDIRIKSYGTEFKITGKVGDKLIPEYEIEPYNLSTNYAPHTLSDNPVYAGQAVRSALQYIINEGEKLRNVRKVYADMVDAGEPKPEPFPKEKELEEKNTALKKVTDELDKMASQSAENNIPTPKMRKEGPIEHPLQSGTPELNEAIDTAIDTADVLGGATVILEDESTVGDSTAAQYKAEGVKAWYDSDGSVHLYVPNIESKDDAQFSICHEKLGHEGLKALFGSDEGVTQFGQYIFDNASKDIRQRIIERADREGYSWKDEKRFSKAAQEEFSDIAGEGPRTKEEFSLWTKIKHYLIKFLKKIGLRVRGLLNDHDMAYYVLKTGEVLKKWDRMSNEEKKEASTADRMFSRTGKPRKKKDESMAQYFNRLKQWEKWRVAEETSKAANDPMPVIKDYNEKAEKAYRSDVTEWKDKNNIPEGDKGAGSFPKRDKDESPQDYAIRVANYEETFDKWQDAPDYFKYMKKAQDDCKQDYIEWKTRYNLNEEENVDMNFYEGKSPEETETEEEYFNNLDAESRADRDMSEAVGVDTTPEGARKQAKIAIIERRKNLESASAEDAIYLHDFVRKTNEIAKSIRQSEGKNVTGKMIREALPYIIEMPLRESSIKNDIQETADHLNTLDTIINAHSKITAKALEAARPQYIPLLEAWSSWKDSNNDLAKAKIYTQAASDFAKAINAGSADVPGYNNIYADEVMKAIRPFMNAMDKTTEKLMPQDVEAISKNADVQSLVNDIHDWYENFYHCIEDAGLRRPDVGHINNGYVNHIWDKEKSSPEAWQKYVENFQRTKSPNMRKREILTYMEGEKLGLVKKHSDIADIMAYYSRSNNEAIANKKLLDDLSFITVSEKNINGEVINEFPLMDSNKPSFDADRYAMYNIPGIGDVYVLKEVQRRFASVFGTMRTQDIPEWLTKTGGVYDVTASTMKKIQLAFSGFHMGALTEVAMAQMRPDRAMAALFKYIIYDSAKNNTIPAYAHPEDFKLASKHLVQLGATQDYAAADVNALTEKLRNFVRGLANDENVGKKAIGYTATPLATALDYMNKGMDKVLWNYLHDGLKIASFKMFSEQIAQRAEKENLTHEQQEQLLDEAGQYVNDTFGGQYWELLNVSPGTLKWLRRAFLSPDWLVSTQRHFFANFGFGSLYSEGGFLNYLRYNRDNIKRVFGVDVPHNEYRRFRSGNAKKCYILGVCCFFYTLMNALNAMFRAQDKGQEEEKAEEMRKNNPDYKSPYELAYPNGMKWYDYTMLGNSLGQQTHLFVGRYKDGSEMYARWGKQFREFPEMFIGRKGLEFPAPMIERLMGKSNPMIGLVRDNLGALGIWGFSSSNDIKDIQAKYGKTIGLLAMNARHFLPFSLPTQAEKEFKAIDLIMPSQKGFTRYKTIDFFQTFIKAGDMKGIENTYHSAVINGIDAEKCLKAAITTLKAEQREEMSDGIKNLNGAFEKYNQASTLKDKKYFKTKIIKYMAESNYKAFTRAEAIQDVNDYLNGDTGADTGKANDKYIMQTNAEDIRDDYKLSALHKQAKKYIAEVEEARTDDNAQLAEQLGNRYKCWFQINSIINAENRIVNKLKKQFGHGSDDEVIDKIRNVRREAMHKLGEIHPPK